MLELSRGGRSGDVVDLRVRQGRQQTHADHPYKDVAETQGRLKAKLVDEPEGGDPGRSRLPNAEPEAKRINLWSEHGSPYDGAIFATGNGEEVEGGEQLVWV